MSGPAAGRTWPLGAPAAVPTARALRARARRGQRGNRPDRRGDALADLYTLAVLLAMYGGAGVKTTMDYAPPEAVPTGTAGVRDWLTLASLMILSGLVFRGLRAFGPLFATPAAVTFGYATPVTRAGLLASRLVAVVCASAVAGAAVAAVAGGLAQVAAMGATVLVGVCAGSALGAAAVATMGAPAVPAGRRQIARYAGAAAIGCGVLGAAAVSGAHAAGVGLPVPAVPMSLVALVAAAGAVLAVTLAARSLPRIDRAGLVVAAEVATAVAGSATMLDPLLLTEVLSRRRWQRVGAVRSGHLWRGPRWFVLLQADLRRLGRRRGALMAFLALLVVPYPVALISQTFVNPARIIAAYFAVGNLAGGLRAVCRSAPLRRALGGTDIELRSIHLVVPAVGLAIWWALTLPVATAQAPVLSGLLAAGVLLAAYRAAGRRPISYSGLVVDTPTGPLPLDLLVQVFRGLNILAIVLLVSVVADWAALR